MAFTPLAVHLINTRDDRADTMKRPLDFYNDEMHEFREYYLKDFLKVTGRLPEKEKKYLESEMARVAAKCMRHGAEWGANSLARLLIQPHVGVTIPESVATQCKMLFNNEIPKLK